MKRFLIPLLAALALPTAVSAEVIYLRCTGSSKWYPYFEVAINEAGNNVNVFGTRGKSASLKASSGNFLIENYRSSTQETEIIYIDRISGKFDLKVPNRYGNSNSLKAGKGKCTKALIEKRAF